MRKRPSAKLTPEGLARSVALAVRRQRQALELTQAEAAERCATSVRLYQQVESAKTNLTLETLCKLCVGLDTTPAALFNETASALNARPSGRPRVRG